MRHLFKRVVLVLAALALLPVQTVGATTYVTSSSFANSTTGAVTGFNSDETGFVSYTSDGGQTFTGSMLTGTFYPPLGALVDGTQIFAFRDWFDSLSYSPDAGANWELSGALMSETAPSRPQAIVKFAGGRIAVAGYLNWDAIGQPAFLITSTDQGQTWNSAWTTKYGPLYPAPSPDDDPPYPLSSLRGMDVDPSGTFAWAVGSEAKKANGVATAAVPLIRKTSNAGSTWTTQTASGLSLTAGLSEVSASSSQTVFATDGSKSFIRSSNGGTSWTRSDVPLDVTRPVAAQYMSAKAIDSRGSKVVIAGLYGKIAYTANGLASPPVWKFYNVPSAVALNGVTMLSDTNWVVVGDNETIVRTTDGGLTWSVQNAGNPSGAITAPSAGFQTGTSPVAISGTAADVGLGVKKVEVEIRTTSGLYYNPNTSSWQAQEVLVPASTLNGWKNWTASWSFSPAGIPAGNLVTVRAKATDVTGRTGFSTSVVSGLPPAPTVTGSIALLSDYTATTTVPVAVSSTNAEKMRWSTGGTWSAWTDAAAEAAVTLPPGDGTKTVTFEFSSSAVSPSPEASASDQIVLDTTHPQLTWVAPTAGFVYRTSAGAPVTISGTVADTASGVEGVEVSVAQNGKYWNGTGWAIEPTWLDAAIVGDSWTYEWYPDDASKASGQPVTVSVRTADALGNAQTQSRVSEDPLDTTAISLSTKSAILAYGGTGYIKGVLTSEGLPVSGAVQVWQKPYNRSYYTRLTIRTVYSNGAFNIAVKPSVKTYYQVRFAQTSTRKASSSSVVAFTPRVSLTTPYAPYKVRRGAAFNVYGYLKPAHVAGTYPVRIYKERYVSGRWVSYGYVYAKAYKYYSYTKYLRAISLPYAGTWRLRAYHYDAAHAATYSYYRTVRVY